MARRSNDELPSRPRLPVEGDPRINEILQNPSPGGTPRLFKHDIEAFAAKGMLEEEQRVRDELTAQATAIAKRYHVDVARVTDILERARYGPVPAGLDRTPPAYQLSLRSEPEIERALSILAPDEALSLFENSDPLIVANRAYLVRHLFNPSTPFYTLGELSDLLFAYAEHHELNRQSLVQTGYPRTSFERSRWLDNFTLMYPVKLPVSCCNRGAVTAEWMSAPADVQNREESWPRDEAGNVLYSYTWAARDTSEIPPKWLITEDYEMATYTSPLSPELIRHLDEGRAAFFEVKLGIIRACAASLSADNEGAVWSEALSRLTESLSGQEAEFFLRTDSTYWQYNIGEMIRPCGPALSFRPEGLTGLFVLIGYCESERRIGTFHRTKTRAYPVFSDLGPGVSYYEAQRHACRGALDEALDAVPFLEHRRRTFFTDFWRRIDHALANDFSDVVHGNRIPRKLRSQYEGHIQAYADWVAQQVRVDRSLLSRQLWSDEVVQSAEDAVFRRQGDFWILGYEGKTTHLKHKVGLNYIAYLLLHPRSKFPVVDLECAVRGTPVSDPAERLYGDMSAKGLADESLSVVGLSAKNNDEVIDPKAYGEIRQRRKGLRESLEAATETGNRDRAAALAEELESVEQYLRRAQVPGRGIRKFDGPSEKIRKRVTNDIKYSLDAIKKKHETLWKHLVKSLNTGTSCCSYDPEKPVHWTL